MSSSVTKNNIEKIDELAKNTGIEWFCTPMYSAAVEFLEPFLERFKIREIDARELVKGNTTELVDLILETKKPIIASAENIPIKHTDISNLKWLYCIPKYPCEYAEIDFEKMKFFDGYSNHCPSISAPIDAVKNGAKIIEVHTTLDKTKEFIDNNVSFDYNELTQLVEKIRMIEKELP